MLTITLPITNAVCLIMRNILTYIYKYLHYMYISFTKPCMTGQKVGM